MSDNRFDLNPHSFILDTESSAVYYYVASPEEGGSPLLLLIAPTRDMAVKLAHDLAKFYGVPLKSKGYRFDPERKETDGHSGG